MKSRPIKESVVWQPSKVAYTIEEVSELLSISRAQLYRLIELEELPSIKIGKSRRVTYYQLDAFLRKLEQESGFVRL